MANTRPLGAVDSGDATDSQALEDVLAELGASAGFVRVMKWDERNPSRAGWGVVGKFPLSDFDPYTLAESYGEGRFRMQFLGPNGARIVRTLEQLFLLPVGKKPAAAGGTNGQLSAADPFVKMLLDDRSSMMQFQQQMTLAIVSALGGARGGATPTLTELLAVMKDARSLAAPAAPAQNPNIAAVKEAFELVKSLSEGRNGGDGSSEDKPSMLERLAPQVLDLLGKVLSRPTAGAGVRKRRAAAPAKAIEGGTEPEPTAPPDPESAMRALVKEYAPHVIAEAKAGRDPVAWGEFIAERCPEKAWGTLVNFASLDQKARLEFLGRFAPEALPFAVWIDGACEGVLALVEPDEPADGTDAGVEGAGADEDAERPVA